MINRLILVLIVFLCTPFSLLAQKKGTFSSKVEVEKNAKHISRITKDSIITINGSTYAFTVHTPEDKGLVSTTATVKQLLTQIKAIDKSIQRYVVKDKAGNLKEEGSLAAGDKLMVLSQDGKTKTDYAIGLVPAAIGGQLSLGKKNLTVNTNSDLTMHFTAGQRTPDATVNIYIPKGITITEDNTTVNVIGRGAIKLKHLATQSIGKGGTNYSYKRVGSFVIRKLSDGRSCLLLTNLDLRPANGSDLDIVISNVNLVQTGDYVFKAGYTTSKPEALTSIETETTLTVTKSISDLERVVDKSLRYRESADTYTKAGLRWSALKNTSATQVMQSVDKGKTWSVSSALIDTKKGTAMISNLSLNKLYLFRLSVIGGLHKGFSNSVQFYSGKIDVKSFGVIADGNTDNTDQINEAIDFVNKIGGGTLLFSNGVYKVRTVYLKSNVYLYIDKGATIKALKGADEPEVTWFSDEKYRDGLSPTDSGPYDDPENYLTKQDFGHHYFHNAMFFAERLDNVKIIGNGYIMGNHNLFRGNFLARHPSDNLADKMFTMKLCTNIEIGGIPREEDLWYDPEKDEPYYITKNGLKDFDTNNMLKIDEGGHFVLLATGTDNINVHDTYFSKYSISDTRDIYDFMSCNHVTVTNVYSKFSSDDFIKLGSDCSLGFTRPARNYKVRNVIGDTNCNLFQIGSESADAIMDVYVDNIYVLAAGKAGFSISTNDGGHVKNIHLNSADTGPLHSRSKMLRTYVPFFISISNRGRVLGSTVERHQFLDHTLKRDELLVTNVNIGAVENIFINGIDISEVYSGSSYDSKGKRWPSYDKQDRSTPIIAGYKLPDSAQVEGGLNFKLPNGNHTGYIKNISFNDMHILVKGGNPIADSDAIPPELGVGQYNVFDLKVQPSYGLWARHVKELAVTHSSFKYENEDHRYVLFLDDVIDAKIEGIKAMKSKDIKEGIKVKNASNIKVEGVMYYTTTNK